MAQNSLSLPDELVQLLAAADQARHFPPGTMASLMQQEVGGQLPQFLSAPDTYHYQPDAGGKRKSTARGLFGVLEGTARDPGYGVAPLKDWTPQEQVRFAADYLDARSKSAGSLHAGLAGFGEGEKYARQVARRRDVTPGQPVALDPVTVTATPEQVAAARAEPEQVAQAAAPQVQAPIAPLAPAPMDPEHDAWTQYVRGRQEEMAKRFGLNYGAAEPAPAAAPVTAKPAIAPEELASIYDIPLNARPSFGMFQGLSHLGRRKNA